ncbi:MAG: LysR family transcriptional regulator [Oscillospiraceae bacterium]|nr:LysR family transcriptional regulator [Oscillospiraceae bacterium]
MDLTLLKEFSVLAETLSYQKAARRLGISHSTLTKHVQKLETELGEELLTRTTRSVQLSPYGEIYQNHVKKMLSIHDQALAELRQFHDEEAHVLRMVFLPAPERYGIAELLSGFQRAEPGIRIDLLDSDDPRGMLLEDRCHLAIAVERDVDIPEIEKILYKRDRLAVVLPETHPLSGAASVRVE